MRKELMRFKRIWVHKYFFHSKTVLDIPKRVKDADKVEQEPASTSQQDNNMKQAD